jgi:hypothetical protein
MVKKLTFPTLTLLSYDDSVAELSRRNLNEVRLETGTRDENRSAPAPLRNDIIALTAENVENGITEVLACTFRVGGCWELFADRHPECTGNLENAVEILTTTLQADGAAVLPGVYAHETNWGYAHPSALWRFRKDGEKHILVPGTVPRKPSGDMSRPVSMEEVTR